MKMQTTGRENINTKEQFKQKAVYQRPVQTRDKMHKYKTNIMQTIQPSQV